MIEVVVSDFGGVLTTPLWEGFARVNERLGVPPEALGRGLATLAERTGEHPLHALERGEVSEPDFLEELGAVVAAELGREVPMQEFPEHYWETLRPNEPMIARLGELRAAGYRLALLTNNVREWEPRWRAMLPVDELFEVVVDSAFVGCRKPEPEIYALTVERLGVDAGSCVLVDDFEINCDGARTAGMAAVQFADTEQALGELDALLRAEGAHGAP